MRIGATPGATPLGMRIVDRHKLASRAGAEEEDLCHAATDGYLRWDYGPGEQTSRVDFKRNRPESPDQST